MTSHIAYKFRLKPTKEQAKQLNEWFGISRFVWNYYLTLNKSSYVSSKKFIFKHEMITGLPNLKKKYDWIEKIPSQALQQKCADLDSAIQAVWKYDRGFPKYKSKHIEHHNSIRIPNSPRRIKVTKKQVKIPKIGWIGWMRHRPITGSLKSITIKIENGYYWCICLCKINDSIRKTHISEDKVVGIDLGINNFVITSNGEVFESLKPMKKQLKKLKRAHRKLSRSKRASKNRAKARRKLNRIYYKIKNQRKDMIHQISRMIANSYDYAILEDLNISGMMKNRHLSRSISDQGWGMFVNALEYKMNLKGGGIHKINRFAPSTKTCHKCDHKQNMPLWIRTYNCPKCGMILNRDINAGCNIKRWGIEDINRAGTVRIYACGDSADGGNAQSLPSQVSLKQENSMKI